MLLRAGHVTDGRAILTRKNKFQGCFNLIKIIFIKFAPIILAHSHTVKDCNIAVISKPPTKIDCMFIILQILLDQKQ